MSVLEASREGVCRPIPGRSAVTVNREPVLGVLAGFVAGAAVDRLAEVAGISGRGAAVLLGIAVALIVTGMVTRWVNDPMRDAVDRVGRKSYQVWSRVTAVEVALGVVIAVVAL